MTQAIASGDAPRDSLLMVAAGGVLSGVLTPLMVPLIDWIGGGPGDFRIALVAIPFAVLVFVLVRRCSANPRWASLAAAIVTMVAFVGAVNAAIWIDGQTNGAEKPMRNMLAGLAGGFVGSAVMALAIGLLPRVRATRSCGCRCCSPALSPARCWRSTMCSASILSLGALSGMAGERGCPARDGLAAWQAFLTKRPTPSHVKPARSRCRSRYCSSRSRFVA